MILVTGAGGKTGQAVLEALTAKSEAVRALVRCQEQIPSAGRRGAEEVVVADLLNPVEMSVAMAGVRAAYLIAPNMHPEEARIGELAIAAAREAGVQRIVFHSVLHPQTQGDAAPLAEAGCGRELFESGLGFTISAAGRLHAKRAAVLERDRRRWCLRVPIRRERRPESRRSGRMLPRWLPRF